MRKFQNQLILLLSSSVLLVASCSKSEDKKSEPAAEVKPAEPAAKPAEPAPEPEEKAEPAVETQTVLTIKAATLRIDEPGKNNDDLKEITLAEDGTVSAGGKAVGQVNTDGTFKDPSGKVLASIDATGKLSFSGQDKTGMVSKDGTVKADDKVICSFDAEGKFTFEGKALATYEGPEEAKMAMVVAFFSAVIL
jgi:hypothetical protein